jgi:hypothetical protein
MLKTIRANAELVRPMDMYALSPAQRAVMSSMAPAIYARVNEQFEKYGAEDKFKKLVQEKKKIAKHANDFLYVRVRAITAMEAGCPCVQHELNCTCGAKGIKVNNNGDAFPEDELVKAYTSFISKGNFVDHKSDEVDKIRGIVIDAHWNPKGKYVECLLAVDKLSHPQLARDIETGVVHGVSMGCQVSESECSVVGCHKLAQKESDYCLHVKNYKGLRYNGSLVYEINRGLNFIELSWVTNPADPQCVSLQKIASQTTDVKRRQIKLNHQLRREQIKRIVT